MSEFPVEMQSWKSRADLLVRGFHPTSKEALTQLKSFLEVCNGDTSNEKIVHWCQGCCDSDAAAMQKALSFAIPLFCRGYQVPLLYRFKHYTVASSYIRMALCCFSLLSQVLGQMQDDALNQPGSSSKLSEMANALLYQDGSATTSVTLDDLLENDLSYSLQNSIRKQKVVAEVRKPEFVQSAIMLDSIVDALEYGSNVLFKRTSLLTKLASLGSEHPEYQDLCAKSKEYFLEFVCGELGQKLILQTMNLLESGLNEMTMMGFVATEKRLGVYYTLIIACCTDLWRRLVFEYEAYPFKWFSFLRHDRITLEEFVQRWDDIVCAKQACPCCHDSEFTHVLLAECPTLLSTQSAETQSELYLDVMRLLSHIACFSPANSDAVEVKHGNMQWAVAKRGSQFVKKEKAAIEVSLLHTVIKQHGIAQAKVTRMTMPSGKVKAAIERQLGVSSRNQFSKVGEEAGAGASIYTLGSLMFTCCVCFP